MSNGVTWKGVLLLLATAIAVSVGSTWALLDLHAKSPHDSAASKSEFQLLRDDIKEVKAEIRQNRVLIYELKGD